MGLFDFLKPKNNLPFRFDVISDKNATKTNETGEYNFKCITEEENQEIIAILKATIDEFQEPYIGIGLAFKSEAAVYKPRYILNQIIIEYCSNSYNKFDILAKAIAFSRKSAKYRSLALSEFEKYFSSHEIAEMPQKNGLPIYSEYRLFCVMAELYEKEYQFESALYCLEQCLSLDSDNLANCERYAKVLSKIDINKAVVYLEKIISTNDKAHYLSDLLTDFQKKATKGYKFKPRNKPTDENNFEEDLIRLAKRYLNT